MKKIFNKGPATNVSCACGAYNSTAENDYIAILEIFIKKLYPDDYRVFWGFSAQQAEDKCEFIMLASGYDMKHVLNAFAYAWNTLQTPHNSVKVRFDTFINRMLRKLYTDYPKKEYPLEFRFVLTLVLGYLNKLTDCAIIIVDDVEPYFKAKIKDVPVEDLIKAVNQTRCYVKASNDNKLAEGMRRVEAWFEEYHSKIIPPKEVTIADIEKQLGYKIKIVGEDK